MKKFRFIVLLFSLSCQTELDKKDLRPTILTKNKSFDTLADTVFLSSVTDIEYIDGRLYIIDFSSSRVVVMDSTYSVLKIFGREGDGPQDLKGPMRISANETSFFIANDQTRSFKRFNKNFEYIDNIKFVNSAIIQYPDIATDDKNIYQMNGGYEILSTIEIESKSIENIGSINQLTLPTVGKSIFQTNSWHVALNGKYIYAVNECEPIIQKYNNASRELIHEYDLRSLDPLKSRLKYVEDEISQEMNSNSAYDLFPDVYIIENHVYLLITGYNEMTKKTKSHELILVELGDEEATLKKIYTLNRQGWYDRFTIVNDRLITFENYSGRLEEYYLETHF